MLTMFEDEYDIRYSIDEMVTLEVLAPVCKGTIKPGKNMITPNILGVYRILRGPLAGKEVEISWGVAPLTKNPLNGAPLMAVGVSTADESEPNNMALSLEQLDNLLRWTEVEEDGNEMRKV